MPYRNILAAALIAALTGVANAADIEPLVSQSDDFGTYQGEFMRAAESLISSGRCTPADFRELGGWVKSMTHRHQPIYFTYCGGMTTANRIYLNAATGEVFR